MKTVLKKQKVEVSDDLEMHQFRVAASAEMFELLASSLYSRKYEAVVRELSCNAYDAHIEAGREDKPFDIKIPTVFDDVFAIRDYGPGLSPDQVKNLYTVMGLSDKTHTNAMVGAFGVGSKSPFSVTRHFSIESFQGGKKWTWAALLDEDNIPSITLADEVITDQPDGLRISFASTAKKEWREALDALTWFDVKPNCNATIPQRPNHDLKGEDWSFSKGVYGHGYWARRQKEHYFYCVMGNVKYKVDKDQLVYNNLPSGHYYLFVDIGDVSPAASREYLRYDTKTVQFLRSMVKRIEKDIKTEALDQIQNAKTLKEAIGVWAKNVEFLKLGPLEYGGQKYEMTFKEKRAHTQVSKSSKPTRYKVFAHRLTTSHNRAVVWADEARAKNIRATEIMENNGYTDVYVFDEPSEDLAKKCAMPYHKTSEVEYTATKSSSGALTGPSEAAKKDMLILDGGKWKPIEGDLPNKAWWIQIGWGQGTNEKEAVPVKQKNYIISPEHLNHSFRRCKKFGVDPGFPIIGIKTRALDEVPKNWIHCLEFFEGIRAFLSDVSFNEHRLRKIRKLQNVVPQSVWEKHHSDLREELKTLCDNKSLLSKLFDRATIEQLYSNDSGNEDIQELIEKAHKAFPNEVFRWYQNTTPWNEVADGQNYP